MTSWQVYLFVIVLPTAFLVFAALNQLHAIYMWGLAKWLAGDPDQPTGAFESNRAYLLRRAKVWLGRGVKGAAWGCMLLLLFIVTR